MVMNRRAQFFLLAAVIISAVVISLGVTANRVTVNKEPENFYDFSYEVKREIGAILDYNIYTNFDSNDNLDDFVDLLAEDIRDNNPGVNFKFIYGDNTFLVEKDFTDTTGSNKEIISNICFGNFCEPVGGKASDFINDAGITNYTAEDIGDNDVFVVKILDQDFSFPISKHKQVVFIMQKDVEDESFVTFK